MLLVWFLIGFSENADAQCESNLNPFDFEINLLDVADSSLKINWPYYTGASDYRFKLTDKKTNIIMMDSVINGNYMEVYNLLPKTLYKLNITVLCSNGNQMASYFADIRTLNKLNIADVALENCYQNNS